MYFVTTLLNFIVGAAELMLLVVIIVIVRYYKGRRQHLSQAQVNDKINEIASNGMTTCTTPIHALDVVMACPVKTKIQKVSETLYNVRETKE